MFNWKICENSSYLSFILRKNLLLIQFYYLRFENLICYVEQNLPTAIKKFEEIRGAVSESA